MKKKTKIIIGVVIALFVILGGGSLYLNNAQSKVTPLTLSEDQINTDTTILNEFMTAVDNNDENSYITLTTNDMNADGTFEKVVKGTKDNFGEFKSAVYKEAVKSGVYDVLLFDGTFTNKNNVQITFSLNSDGKVAGIYLK